MGCSSATTGTDSNGSGTTEDQDKVYGVGEKATKDGVDVTVTEVKSSKGNEWGKPGKGNKFVYAKFSIVNNTDEEISVSSIISFEAYCDDAKIDMSSAAFLSSATSKMKQLDGSIAKGKKMEGWIGYEISKKAKSLEIHYLSGLLDSDKIVFSVLK